MPKDAPMPNEPPRIEIVTGNERRRRYSAEHKLQLVEETVQPRMTVSAVARLHGVSPSLLFKWRQLMSEGGRTAVRADEDVVGSLAPVACASWRPVSETSSGCSVARRWRSRY
jgi:transposase-like protein